MIIYFDIARRQDLEYKIQLRIKITNIYIIAKEYHLLKDTTRLCQESLNEYKNRFRSLLNWFIEYK